MINQLNNCPHIPHCISCQECDGRRRADLGGQGAARAIFQKDAEDWKARALAAERECERMRSMAVAAGDDLTAHPGSIAERLAASCPHVPKCQTEHEHNARDAFDKLLEELLPLRRQHRELQAFVEARAEETIFFNAKLDQMEAELKWLNDREPHFRRLVQAVCEISAGLKSHEEKGRVAVHAELALNDLLDFEGDEMNPRPGTDDDETSA